MDREVYNRAVGRIGELQAQLQRLKLFVATYRELVDDAGGTRSSRRPTGHVAAGVNEMDDEDERYDHPKATPQAELERVVEQILVANGAPLQRMELLQRVKALGVIIGGRNEVTNFGSKLSRAVRLVNLPKLGYWPKDEPFEPGAYHPGSAGRPAAA